VFTLTNSATLVIEGAADYTTVIGTSLDIIQDTSTIWRVKVPPVAAPQLLIISDQKTIGTAGSYYASTSWVKHDITSEDYNTIVGASVDIVGHTITLPAGTYKVSGSGPINYKSNFAVGRLRDTTNSVDASHSKNAMSHSSYNSSSDVSFLDVFTLAGTSTLELQVWRQTAGATVASTFHTEKYMELMFEKIG
jgi:hypothetical protein